MYSTAAALWNELPSSIERWLFLDCSWSWLLAQWIPWLRENSNHVDLIEGPLHQTVASLQLEKWRNGMNEEIDSIAQILGSADAGQHDSIENYREREKVKAKVLGKSITACWKKLLRHSNSFLFLKMLRWIMSCHFLILELPLNKFWWDDHEVEEYDVKRSRLCRWGRRSLSSSETIS